MANKGGVLKVVHQCITVDFGGLFWFQSHGKCEEIRNYWNKQGYAEAEPIPYQRNQDGLIVQRNLEAFGWAVAGNACREIYEIPF